MKGTARPAISSWEEGINLTILPAGSLPFIYPVRKTHSSSFSENLSPKKISQRVTDTVKRYRISIPVNRRTGILYWISKRKIMQAAGKLFRKNRNARLSMAGIYHDRMSFTCPAVLSHPLDYTPESSPAPYYDSIMVGLFFLLYPVYLLFARTVMLESP